MWYEILYRVLSIINYVVLVAIAVPLLLQILYVVLFWIKKKTFPVSEKKGRVAYIIPAHNEEDVIYGTVKSLFDGQLYPADKFDVYVVAHNCTDATATLAERAGAKIIEVNDREGEKKFVCEPLKIAIDRIISLKGEDAYDFIIRLDADNHVNPEFTSLMNDAYFAGAEMARPYEGALNATQNFYTKACALFYAFDSRYGSRVRERLGIAAHINGSGSMFSVRLFTECGGYDCTGITEDAEFNFNRMLEGKKGHFVEDAVVYEDMPSSMKDTINRNRRIGSGSIGLLKSKLLSMLGKFFVTGNFSYLEMFLTYSFNFLSILFSLWLPVYYVAHFLFLWFAGNGFLPLSVQNAEWYSAHFTGTIVIGGSIVAGLFVVFGFLQALFLVVSDYKKFGAKNRRSLLSGVFLFPVFLALYSFTLAVGAMSKPKWNKISRNTGTGENAANNAEKAIVIEHLVKSYGDIKAVDDISFEVEKGSLFAFLGVNGAGKSTAINVICSILQKDGGKVRILGYDADKDVDKIKREIGIVFQNGVLDKELSVKQNLFLRASFYPLSKAERKKNVEEVVELLQLKSVLNRPVGSLSGGQARRVDIARAMVHRPKLLILDEPTTGLDPGTRLSVWALIDRVRRETGMTVFLTTHYLEEADRASEVVIMDKGKIIVRGTPNELKNAYSEDSLFSYGERDISLEKTLESEGRKYSFDAERKAYRISVSGTDDAKALLDKAGDSLKDIEIIKGNLDDVFLNVTGKNIRITGGSDDV